MLLRGYRFFSTLVDELVLSGNVVLEQTRAFSRTEPGRPPSFDDLIGELERGPAQLHWEQPRRILGGTRIPVTLRNFGAETFFDLHRAPGGQARTLVVYHHGLGEIPHNGLPSALFRGHPKLRKQCDWIAIKGLYHDSFKNVSLKLLGSRNTFMRSLVSSAAVAKAIVDEIGERYEHLIMCGTSMGGIISLVESLHEPRYDLTVPFVAGPNLPDVMLHSGFAKLVHRGFRRRELRAPWLPELDMTSLLAGSDGPPIRPLLARSDRLFRHEVQNRAYDQIARAQVTSFEGGHITGAATVPVLARHLCRMIDEHCWNLAAHPEPQEALATP